MKQATTRITAACCPILLVLLTGCDSEMVPTDVYKRVVSEKSQLESTISSTKRQLDEAQQSVTRKQQEQAQLEGRLQEAQKAREQAERHLKDSETTITRQERVTARAERGISFWRVGSAFLFVLAVVLLFIGAAAGSATRKEVQREQSA